MSCVRFAVLLSIASACAPETTSFRTTEKNDEPHANGVSAAAYDVAIGGDPIAHVRVWSSGGYLSTTDEPMSHAGFEIRNTGTRTILFDGDALEMIVFDGDSIARPASFASLIPTGALQVQVRSGATAVLGAYFSIPVRPRAVERMLVRWSLTSDEDQYAQVTNFIRDDNASVSESPAGAAPTRSSS